MTTPDAPGTADTTGNWQITIQTTSGAAPFTALTGSFLQQGAGTTYGTPLYTVLQAINPSSCFIGQTAIPSIGYVNASAMNSTSLSVNGQSVVVAATESEAGGQLTGKFNINGGCANGTAGTVSGIKIPSLTGTFSGILSLNKFSLTLVQDSQADGLGYFHEEGTLTFGGTPCFTSGTLVGVQSTTSGKQVVLTIAASDKVSTIQAIGVVSDAADSLTLNTVQVTGSSSCQGSLGSITLTKQ